MSLKNNDCIGEGERYLLIRYARTRIENLVEQKRFWRRGEAVYLQNMISRCMVYGDEMFSIASSTYYAASNDAVSRAKKASLFYKPLWYWRAWIFLRSAEKTSDKFASLKSLKDMTIEEIDLRSHILEKTKRLAEAQFLLSYGSEKMLASKQRDNDNICCFLIREAQILFKLRKYRFCGDRYKQMLEFLEESESSVSVLTKVEIFKMYGYFLATQKYPAKAEEILNSALDLARENCLYEQVRKIKKIISSFRLVIR